MTSMRIYGLLAVLGLLGCTVNAGRTNSTGKHWALIVAGSSSWGNYRHQADVCHAYQVLHNHGIPDENIVVMMYDDIAHNEENPTPGVIINKIGGPNVYKGIVKDYTKEDVTPKVFLDVLQGKKTMRNNVVVGSGKVIDSGPDDNVFVYFSDHGAPGLIAFPDEELMADDLMKAIKNMHSGNRYRKMVFYVEACESGSMFDKLLPDNIKVYATTAANPHESSYACYYDKKLETYLGDLYSVKWLENSDSANLDVETLLKQFKVVERETNTSHVMKYGDMSFEKEIVDDFQGDPEASSRPMIKINAANTPEPKFDAVPAPDVSIAILEHRLKDTKDPEKKKVIQQKLDSEIKMRYKIQDTVKEIAGQVIKDNHLLGSVLHKPAEPRNFECYKKAIKAFKKSCFNFKEYEYALRHVHVLSNLCEMNIPENSILEAINGVCKNL